MAKGIYLGIDSLSRKVKKMYLGIEGVARKVKKGYVGVNGLARLFFSGVGKPVYLGNSDTGVIAPLPLDWWDLEGASNPGYALFAGGTTRQGETAKVGGYNSELVYSEAQELRTENSMMTGSSVGNYALFGKGYSSWVDAYDESLVRVAAPSTANSERDGVSATFGDMALFAGGDLESITNELDAYDESLTRIRGNSVRGESMAGAAAGNYVVFAGGYVPNSSGTISHRAYSYTRDLTLQTLQSGPRVLDLGGGSTGKYAIFAGGATNVGSPMDASYDVYAYDEELVSCQAGDLSVPRYNMQSFSFEGLALFALGQRGHNYDGYSGYSVIVESVDDDLTTEVALNIDNEHRDGSSAIVGNYAVIAGAEYGTDVSVIEIA